MTDFTTHMTEARRKAKRASDDRDNDRRGGFLRIHPRHLAIAEADHSGNVGEFIDDSGTVSEGVLSIACHLHICKPAPQFWTCICSCQALAAGARG